MKNSDKFILWSLDGVDKLEYVWPKTVFREWYLAAYTQKHPKKELFISKVETMKIDFFGKAKSPKID